MFKRNREIINPLGILFSVLLCCADALNISQRNERGWMTKEKLREENSFRMDQQIKLLRDDSHVVIDGKSSTIGLVIGWSFAGLYADSDVMEEVAATLSPEEDNHYFDLIKEDVKEVVGDYINKHNMDQLEIYKNDLAALMTRYHNAPNEANNYPDKNTMANSLSTSIMANRYLVEAVELPYSMMLHYSDIASIHIMVLKDAAETYSSESFTSRWWLDLDKQLDHYIDYGKKLQNEVVDWRNDMVECSFKRATGACTMWEWAGKVCFDQWIVHDYVWETKDVCTQVHGSKTCADHCQAYQVEMNREVVIWIWEYMGKALREWENLKIKSSQMVNLVSSKYTLNTS